MLRDRSNCSLIPRKRLAVYGALRIPASCTWWAGLMTRQALLVVSPCVVPAPPCLLPFVLHHPWLLTRSHGTRSRHRSPCLASPEIHTGILKQVLDFYHSHNVHLELKLAFVASLNTRCIPGTPPCSFLPLLSPPPPLTIFLSCVLSSYPTHVVRETRLERYGLEKGVLHRWHTASINPYEDSSTPFAPCSGRTDAHAGCPENTRCCHVCRIADTLSCTLQLPVPAHLCVLSLHAIALWAVARLLKGGGGSGRRCVRSQREEIGGR